MNYKQVRFRGYVDVNHSVDEQKKEREGEIFFPLQKPNFSVPDVYLHMRILIKLNSFNEDITIKIQSDNIIFIHYKNVIT